MWLLPPDQPPWAVSLQLPPLHSPVVEELVGGRGDRRAWRGRDTGVGFFLVGRSGLGTVGEAKVIDQAGFQGSGPG